MWPCPDCMKAMDGVEVRKERKKTHKFKANSSGSSLNHRNPS